MLYYVCTSKKLRQEDNATSATAHREDSHVHTVVYYKPKTITYMCRYDSHSGGEREIQRTMLELLNQLDGFDSKGDVKVLVYICPWRSIHILNNVTVSNFVRVKGFERGHNFNHDSSE